MSDTQPGLDAGREGADLLQGLAAAVLSVPGVLRLEPTLGSSLRRLMPSAPRSPSSAQQAGTATGVDGIIVRRLDQQEGLAQIDVDIATATDAQALHTATAVHHTASDYLSRRGNPRARVNVRVLSIEPR